MDLIRNLVENKFGDMEGEVYFKYLDKYIAIVFRKTVPLPYVNKIVEYLNELNEKVMFDLCRYSHKFCKIMMSDYPDVDYPKGLAKIKEPLEILEYIELWGLTVDMYEDEQLRVINLAGSCAWDEDNGIQWLIKEDEVVYVGSWDDMNIWDSDLDDEFSNYVIMDE